MKYGFSLLALLLFPLAAFADVTKDDVRRLLSAGASEAVIVQFIRENAPAEPLSSTDLADLRAMGATDAILQALLESRPAQAPAPPAYESPSSTYVYAPPTYYYSPYYAPFTPYVSFWFGYPYYHFHRPFHSHVVVPPAGVHPIHPVRPPVQFRNWVAPRPAPPVQNRQGMTSRPQSEPRGWAGSHR